MKVRSCLGCLEKVTIPGQDHTQHQVFPCPREYNECLFAVLLLWEEEEEDP